MSEDGIRLLYVTGVQTCALPISGEEVNEVARTPRASSFATMVAATSFTSSPARWNSRLATERSEERRVGKEGSPWCRARRGGNARDVTDRATRAYEIPGIERQDL